MGTEELGDSAYPTDSDLLEKEKEDSDVEADISAEVIGSSTDCEACYTCDGALEELLGLTIEEIEDLWSDWELVLDEILDNIVMTYAAIGADFFEAYPEYLEGTGWDGSVSSLCGCLYTSLDSGLAYALNPTEREGGCDLAEVDYAVDMPSSTDVETLGVGDTYIINDVDIISESTHFLTSPWNLSHTVTTHIGAAGDPLCTNDADWTLACSLKTGKVGILYDYIVEDLIYKLYHTVSGHGDSVASSSLIFGELSTAYVAPEGGARYWKIYLHEDEIDGIRESFGSTSVSVDAAITSDLESIIAEVADSVVTTSYTFKKIKQPIIEDKLFSAFNQGMKEITQTVAVDTSKTTTTY